MTKFEVEHRTQEELPIDTVRYQDEDTDLLVIRDDQTESGKIWFKTNGKHGNIGVYVLKTDIPKLIYYLERLRMQDKD